MSATPKRHLNAQSEFTNKAGMDLTPANEPEFNGITAYQAGQYLRTKRETPRPGLPKGYTHPHVRDLVGLPHANVNVNYEGGENRRSAKQIPRKLPQNVRNHT